MKHQIDEVGKNTFRSGGDNILNRGLLTASKLLQIYLLFLIRKVRRKNVKCLVILRAKKKDPKKNP